MNNHFQSLKYFLVDIPPKVSSKFLSRKKRKPLSGQPALSDSEQTAYAKYVENVLQNDKLFLKFRKNYKYRQILDHVNYKKGLEYLQKMKLYNINQDCYSEFIERSRGQGQPIEYHYAGIGMVSPTTLRYLATLEEIEYLFDLKPNPKIAEIGIGFAGQIAAFLEYLNPCQILTYDLPAVQQLGGKYLELVARPSDLAKLSHQDIHEIYSTNVDLVVSNYAFSELPRKIQLEYIEKLFKRSSAGYLTMNSGRSNYTGRSEGKLTVDEILDHLPEARVFEESPRTGPDNYLIIWGNARKPLSK